MRQRKGDFKAFFLDHYNAMVRFGMSYLSGCEEAEDVVQDAFIRLYEQWESMESLEHARSFLYLAIRNGCVSRLRHQDVMARFAQSNAQEPEWDDTAEWEATYQETLRLLRKAIDGLPAQSRRIILLKLEGRNTSEIAELLNISPNTVKTLTRNAYRTLRHSLGGLSEDMILFLLLLEMFHRASG